MEYHVRVRINAPGWGSVNPSQFTRHPLKLGYSSREGRGGSLTTMTLIIQGWDLHRFAMVIRTHDSDSK